MLPKLIAYIEKYQPVSYETLLERATLRGLSQDELDDLLLHVHKDKRIRTSATTVLGKETIVYTLVKPKLVGPLEHVTWCSENYPWPGKDGVPPFVMPFPEIDMSYLFLKPDEMEEYRARMKGQPAWLRRKTKSNQTSSSI